MYLAIIVLPLLGSIISGFLGRKVGVKGAQLITLSSLLLTTIFALVAFIEVGLNKIAVSIELLRWIDSESLNVSWAFNFDSLTVSMLIPVLIVSSLVHLYSIGYMSHDPHNQRFFSYLSLFTFMMIILVTGNNFLLMFLGWEGVGICSYLLVNFWYTRIAANQSSVSAFLTNRVGDCFLTIGMFVLLWSFGNLDYYTVFSLAPYLSDKIVTVIGICLLIGAMAKSSQVGLHIWLPMAMEGPTPVSALIHAATMVTAGVYLLIRTSPLIEYSSTVLLLCLWIGSITTIFSSLIGLYQQDIKKVIAYSTMSQLGMMVIAVGLSSYNIALFHLINHAFYKGLLFLGAGAVIHAVGDNQDFRKYGALRSYLPLTYSVILIASLSLVAFPFMTGFYSKDFILESTYGQFYFTSTVVYNIATLGAVFTSLYSVKVLYLTFLVKANGPLINYRQAQENDIFISLPLIILAVFSIFFGYISKDIFIGLASGFFSTVDNSIFIHPSHEIFLDTEFAVPSLFKNLPLIYTIFLSAVSILLSELLPKLLVSFKFSNFGYNIFSFFNQRFLIELLYNKYITAFILGLTSSHTSNVIDKGSVELIGPFGLEKGLLTLSKNIASLNTGLITSYALYILLGLLFYILVPYLSLFDNSLLLLILFALFTLINNLITYNPPKPYSFITSSRMCGFDLKLFKKVFFKTFTLKNSIIIVFIALAVYLIKISLLVLDLDFPALKAFLIFVFSGKIYVLFSEIFESCLPQTIQDSQYPSDLGKGKEKFTIPKGIINFMANNNNSGNNNNLGPPSSGPSSSGSPSSDSPSSGPVSSGPTSSGPVSSLHLLFGSSSSSGPTSSGPVSSGHLLFGSSSGSGPVSSVSGSPSMWMAQYLTGHYPVLQLFHPNVTRLPLQGEYYQTTDGQWHQLYTGTYNNISIRTKKMELDDQFRIRTTYETKLPNPMPRQFNQLFVYDDEGRFRQYDPCNPSDTNRDIFVKYNHNYMKTGYITPPIRLLMHNQYRWVYNN